MLTAIIFALGLIAGSLLTFATHSWRCRRARLALEQANSEARRETFTWTERPIFRGRQ